MAYQPYIRCNQCRSLFDPKHLDQVFEHEHKELTVAVAQAGKRVIANAREVYPDCSGEFAAGVHTFLNGLPMPERPCDDTFIQGWLCAARDLKTDFILK